MPNSAAPAANAAGIPAAGVGSLSTLLRRLEAATSRLEDIAMTQSSTGGPHFVSGASAVQPAPTVSAGAASAPGAAAEEASPSIKAFDEVIDGPLAKYVALSQELGGLIAEQAQQTLNGFTAQRAYIQLAAACKKPSSPASYETIIKPTQQALMAVMDFKEKNRASKESNQLTVVAEGIPALGWVMAESKPGPFVGEYKDASDFWVNKVVKEFKESNPKQVEWARSFTGVLEGLRKYIMQHHTTSLTWNPTGAAVESYAAAPSASAGGAPPPPPPPPPAPPAAPPAPSAPPAPAATRAAAPAAGDMGAVFSALNQGEAVTKGLRKVDKSEMTHKNPELRTTSTVGSTSPNLGKAPQKPPKPQSFQKKPPKTALEGKTWNIENHENNQLILVDETELNQVVNVYNVKSSVIQIKGKVNAISLVNCTKVSLLLDSTVSSLAISSSPSFTVQILGKVPTILIDGTDGGQVYLSKESLDVEIITAKTSAINISLPVEGEEEGIFEEKAVPEQLKTVVVGGKLVTTVVEHSG